MNSHWWVQVAAVVGIVGCVILGLIVMRFLRSFGVETTDNAHPVIPLDNRRGWRPGPHAIRAVCVTATVLVIDLTTKRLVSTRASMEDARSLALVAVSIPFGVVLAWAAMTCSVTRRGLSLPVSILAGAILANSLDGVDGYVQNPLLLHLKGSQYLGFNVADIATCAGIVWLLLSTVKLVRAGWILRKDAADPARVGLTLGVALDRQPKIGPTRQLPR